MDALDKKAFNQLVREGVPIKEAKEQARSLAETMFERDYVGRLQNVTHKPRRTVQLRGTFMFLNGNRDSLKHLPHRHAQARRKL